MYLFHVSSVQFQTQWETSPPLKDRDLRSVLHPPIAETITTLTIRRSSTGNWYACFSVEYEPAPAPQRDTVAGVDVGLESFATFSNGEKNEDPGFFPYRRESACKNTKKARTVVVRIHERIATRRLNFAHQTSRRFVDPFGTIVFEDLNIKNSQKDYQSWQRA
jgi:putative transposase